MIEYLGTKFIGDRLAPLTLGLAGGSRWGSEALVRRFTRGRRVTVYVDPGNPGRAVIEPGRQILEPIFLLVISLDCSGDAACLGQIA